MRRLTNLTALACAAASLVAAAENPRTPRLQPVATSFAAKGSLPGFALHLAPDTASVCNSSTPGIAGRLETHNTDQSRVFFWLFESKGDPLNDPLILWMSGGPGASSAGYGNLMELGPCRIANGGGHTVDNPFAWNTNASVLFVDQPVSVGFSTAKEIPRGIAAASKAMDQFMRQFATAFPQLAKRDFYIAGESYGGSWVPTLATTILSNQGHATSPRRTISGLSVQDTSDGSSIGVLSGEPNIPHLNLQGIMIGNGLVRHRYQNPGTLEAACSGPESLLSPVECERWAPWSAWCEQHLDRCEEAGLLDEECKKTMKKCGALDEYVLESLGRNPYNWLEHCEVEDMMSCVPSAQWVNDFMNRTDIKEALGVPADTEFNGVSYAVLELWDSLGETLKRSDDHVNDLLNSGIRVLIYVGDKDFLAHAAGTRRMVNEGLAWHGSPLFRFRELVPWYSGSKVAGRWKSYDTLTYAEVFQAGHLAPLDKAGETLDLINGWLFNGFPPPA
ncbi:alpha/beta-hydrolase [Sarocladium strictum]